MKKINLHKISSQISLGQFNRVVIAKDLERYAIFGLYERYEDESDFEYELVIDDRLQTHSHSLVRKTIKEFLLDL